MKKQRAFLLAIIFLFPSACNGNTNLPQQTPATLTFTATPSVLAITDTPPPANTATAEAGDSLCNHDYFPNEEDTSWTFQGNNSKIGSTRAPIR